MDQPIPVIPPAPPKKPFSKWPLVLLLGMILGAAAVFAWQKYQPTRFLLVGWSPLASPQPSAESDPTAGWKKYINEKYELQYPQTYQMVNLTAGGGTNIPVNARNIYISDPTRFDYEDRLINIEYIDLLVSPGAKWTEDCVKIDNKETIKFTSGDNSSNFDIYHIYLTDKGGLEVYARKNNPLIDQILSTFKFTVNNQSGWQIFNLPLFTLKLPQDWSKTLSSNPYQFINYAEDQASGRSFDPNLDKNKLKIEVYEEDFSGLLSDYVVQKKNNMMGNDNSAVWQEEQTTIGGQAAIKVEGANIGVKYISYYIKNPTQAKILTIVFGLDFFNYQDLSQQILNTFSFN